MKQRIAFCLLIILLSVTAGAQTPRKTEKRFRQYVYTLAGEEFGGRAAGTRQDTLTMEYLRNFLDAQNGIRLLFDNGVQSFTTESRAWTSHGFQNSGRPLSSFNVAGLIEGRDPVLKNEVIVIGAHYDHMGLEPDEPGGEPKVKYGADDNASGTAMVMALARELARERNKLNRSVMIVFFGAEEQGLLGSEYLASHMPGEVPLENVVYMVNFDMVGRLHPEGGLELYGKELSEYLRTNPWPHAEVAPLHFYPEPVYFSDHASFAARGITTFLFSNDHETDLHKSTDTADKINYHGMTLIYRYVLQLIRDLADLPVIF